MAADVEPGQSASAPTSLSKPSTTRQYSLARRTAYSSETDSESTPLLEPAGTHRGRLSEVDRILQKLRYPPIVTQVALESGVTTRESLLNALRDEEIKLRWSLAMKKGATQTSGSLRRKVISRNCLEDSADVNQNQASKSLNELLSAFQLADSLERDDETSADSSLEPCSTLRQRFVTDAAPSHPSFASSKLLPKRRLVRSASAG